MFLPLNLKQCLLQVGLCAFLCFLFQLPIVFIDFDSHPTREGAKHSGKILEHEWFSCRNEPLEESQQNVLLATFAGEKPEFINPTGLA